MPFPIGPQSSDANLVILMIIGIVFFIIMDRFDSSVDVDDPHWVTPISA